MAINDAVGCYLGHDLTEVDPGRHIKRRLFKRGHLIEEADLERLKDLGKNHIYVWQEGSDAVHEDDAAIELAPLIAGSHIVFDPEPSEGKISFYADCRGVFNVDVERLDRINTLEIPSLPTIHTHFPVEEGKQVAAFRIIPLTCERRLIDTIRDILSTPLIEIKPYVFKTGGIIVTGNEVYEGRIRDGFISKLKRILLGYGVEVSESVILPDDRQQISQAVTRFSGSCDIIFVTGGTSVDPDDQTVAALVDAGVTYRVKGNPIQPGNNFTVGYLGNVCVCAVPAATLYFKATALDIFLPRLLTGEQLTREAFFKAGHGGLCHFCEKCHFPICPFAV